MTELALCVISAINVVLCVLNVPTWITGTVYWAILTAWWFARAVRKGKDKRLGD